MCRLTRPLCILVPHVLPAYAFQKAFMTQKWGIAFLALKHSSLLVVLPPQIDLIKMSA